MQAQDLQAALWAVGQRVPGAGVGDVRAALDRAEIVRSWPMRGTLHLLAPEDLRWMLAITSDRLIRGMAGRHRELGITAADVDAAAAAALQLVSGGGAATPGGAVPGLRGGRASPRRASAASTCSGSCASAAGWCRARWRATSSWSWPSTTGSPSPGPWTARRASPSWLLRYLRSHGPATERDFAWWSGIPLTEVRAALARVSDRAGGAGVRGDQLLALAGDGRAARRRRARAAHGAGAAGVRRVPARLHGPVRSCCRRSTPTRSSPAATACSRRPSWPAARWSAPGPGAGAGRGAAVVPEPFDTVNGLRPAAQKSFELQAAKYRRFLAAETAGSKP